LDPGTLPAFGIVVGFLVRPLKRVAQDEGKLGAHFGNVFPIITLLYISRRLLLNILENLLLYVIQLRFEHI
jgi:hypothetical protein